MQPELDHHRYRCGPKRAQQRARPTWCPRVVTTMSDHNEVGPQPAWTDRGTGGCPGQQRLSTAGACLTNEGSCGDQSSSRRCDPGGDEGQSSSPDTTPPAWRRGSRSQAAPTWLACCRQETRPTRSGQKQEGTSYPVALPHCARHLPPRPRWRCTPYVRHDPQLPNALGAKPIWTAAGPGVPGNQLCLQCDTHRRRQRARTSPLLEGR